MYIIADSSGSYFAQENDLDMAALVARGKKLRYIIPKITRDDRSTWIDMSEVIMIGCYIAANHGPVDSAGAPLEGSVEWR